MIAKDFDEIPILSYLYLWISIDLTVPLFDVFVSVGMAELAQIDKETSSQQAISFYTLMFL